jgi:hypothetical protein
MQKKLKNQEELRHLLGLDKFHSEKEGIRLILQKGPAYQTKTEHDVLSPKLNPGLSFFTEYNVHDRQKLIETTTNKKKIIKSCWRLSIFEMLPRYPNFS